MAEEESDYYFKNFAPRNFSQGGTPTISAQNSFIQHAKTKKKKRKNIYFDNQTTTIRPREKPVESPVKRAKKKPPVKNEATHADPRPTKKSKKVSEIILQNVKYQGNREETAYLLALRLTNKMIKDNLYSKFGAIYYVDVSEKKNFENETCVACLGMWNPEIHSEMVETLNYQVKFYGNTISMKLGRNVMRTNYSWENPEPPNTSVHSSRDSIKEQPTAMSVKLAEVKAVDADVVQADVVQADVKICCDCCYNICCCSCLLHNIQLVYNTFSNTLRNIMLEKVTPVRQNSLNSANLDS